MKKLLFIILLVASSCATEYKDITPEKFEGVKLEIDSTKWTPALIKVEDRKILLYENKEIKKVRIWNPFHTFLLGMGVGALIVLLIAAASTRY